MKHVITLPELQYIAQALHGEVDDPRYAGKNVSGYFSMVFLHDDTKSQLEENVEEAAWLMTTYPSLLPQVNMQMGNSVPSSIYRSHQFIMSPEQYPTTSIKWINDTTVSGNATTAAGAFIADMAENAMLDERYFQEHWPLFNVGAGSGSHDSIRSRSLLRVQPYAATAYGATGLYWYCWGGGLVQVGNQTNTPMIPSVRLIPEFRFHP